MVPFSSFATTRWTYGAERWSASRAPSYEIQGKAAPGKSSGKAMAEIEKLAGKIPGIGVAWSGPSYQERVASARRRCFTSSRSS